MKRSNLSSTFVTSALVMVLCLLAGLAVAAQEKEKVDKGIIINKQELKEVVKVKNKEFCSSENWSSDDKQQYRELRESTVAAGAIDVDAGRNGGISVKGENRSDILVRACIQAWGDTMEAAKAAVSSVRISSGSSIRADGPDESNYSVSFQILVPRNTDLRLKAHNGGISINSVGGRMEFETTNGGVSLADLAGDVRGRTTNGGVSVKLVGRSWDGSGLDVTTSNGGVSLMMPEGYAANLQAGTVNGGFNTNIASLNLDRDDRGRLTTKTINAPLNGGGAPIRVTTTNGGVQIKTDAVKY
jgi:hypothetical protein